MKIINLPLIKRLSIALVLTFSSISLVPAQTNKVAICDEGDCPTALFSIHLEEPLLPSPSGSFSSQRTANFKAAYQKFQQIKSTYANSSEWKAKHDASQIGGQSCVQHYQLESQFTHEYSQNTDFKKFVDSQIANAKGFIERGFESSRRGLNLIARMNNNCPQEIKKLAKKKGSKQEDLPKVYDKLGKDLGYFDKQGKLLKPLKNLTKEQPTQAKKNGKKKSKKEQVAQLKQQVAALPLGQPMRDKISGIKNDLKKTKPKLGLLKGALGLLNSRLGIFLPGPLGLAGKIKSVNDLLGTLKKFLPKISVPNLLSKIGNLFKRGKKLSKKAKDLLDRSKKVKDKLSKITKEADKLQGKVEDKIATINNLQKTLDELAKKKMELEQKLEKKPKKILEELKSQVSSVMDKAKDMSNKVENEIKEKGKLLDKLDELTKAKEKVEEEMKKQEDEFKQLSKAGEALEKDTKEVEKEVEKVKKQEKKLDELKQKIEVLKPEAEVKKEISACEDELKNIFLKITGVDKKQEKLKKKMGGLLALPGKLLSKVSDLKIFQKKLKLPKNGIQIAGKALAKIDKLMGKATAITSTVEVLTGKKSKLQESIEAYDKKLDNIKKTYDSKTADIDKLKAELIDLIAEKSGIKATMDGAVKDVNEIENKVNDFIKRYNIFDKKSDCLGKEDLEQKVEELNKGQENTEPELEELEEELNKAADEEKTLEEETKELEKGIEEDTKKQEELKEEEETIKEEFGTDVKLDPVKVEEWAESFEVERPYWDAVFHPDDEVVEGYKGRYFEIRLKDAKKNIKLLFGPGQYFMDKTDFRDNYGSTIGAFVTEALHSMKKSDKDKIKLFIQGSADIVGQKTFSGNLNKKYFYEHITLLPLKDDEESFSSTPTDKQIPTKNFRNKDLPNLRGNYLKEMIGIYSKKLSPTLLEGAVKKVANKGDRNAIIYLFIPNVLIAEYGER